MLTCTSSAWISTNPYTRLNVEFKQSTGIKTVLVMDAAFRYSESWSRINVSRGFASGGTAIQVTGGIFNFLNTYSCVFEATKETYSIEASATVLSTTSLVCTTPFWNVSAQNSTMTVKSSQGPVTHTVNGPVNFDFISVYRVLTPSSAFSVGGTELTVSGAGFDLQGSYTCVWDVIDVPSASVSANPDPRLLTDASPVSSNEIRCIISEWGKSKGAEVVSFYLLKNVTRGSSWVYVQVERDSESTTNNFTFFSKV